MSTTVDPETGEVLATAVVKFDMASYLAGTNSNHALTQQKGLMAAYDAACHALIGPNDIQKEGARSFKRKSAWRKLARHFGISVHCTLTDVRVERRENGFTAYAVATGAAPWGQSWTDVGACGSDEESGRRTITEADAVATAMTRASNRAVSNLIAMGEVSAEEIGDRKAYSGPRNTGNTRDARRFPFGKNKGKLLTDMTLDDLIAAQDWCQQKDEKKFAELIAALTGEIATRSMNEASEISESNDSEFNS